MSEKVSKEEYAKAVYEMWEGLQQMAADDMVKKILGVEPLEATEFMKKALREKYPGSKDG